MAERGSQNAEHGNDIPRVWRELCLRGAESESGETWDCFEKLLRALISGAGEYCAPFRGLPPEKTLRAIRALAEGSAVEVGALPQAAVALLAGIYFAALGRPVWLVMWRSDDFPGFDKFFQFSHSKLDLEPSFSFYHRHTRQRENARMRQIVFSDYAFFIRSLRRDAGIIQSQSGVVAIFTEIDLCLFDRRLSLFKGNHLCGHACMFRPDQDIDVSSLPIPDPWEGKSGNHSSETGDPVWFDAAHAMKNLDLVCGTSSAFGSSRPVLRNVYGLKTISAEGRRFFREDSRALFFYEPSQRIAALAADIAGSPRSTLVLCQSPSSGEELAETLKDSDVPFSILSDRNLYAAFFQNVDGARRAGICWWLDAMDWPVMKNSLGGVDVVSDFYSFSHHGAKISALGKERFGCRRPPILYLSVQDECVREYASPEQFSLSFQLIDLLEAHCSIHLPRRLISGMILRRIRRFRRAVWDTVFTSLFPAEGALQKESVPEISETAAQRTTKLDQTCFCGSGKLFLECHGAERRGLET